jgi:hypothetical protein
MPKIPIILDPGEYRGPTFEIPREYLCHICSKVMEYPVLTIERWFYSNETSPLTNIVLESLDLRLDVQKREKKAEISAFPRGSDITSRYRNLGGVAAVLQVTLKSPLNTWSLSMPHNLKLSELWEIAYLFSKGRYAHFELQH